MNPPPPILAAPANFYVTGGTLRPDAPSYVERRADRELIECLRQGSFCYVLTSRQMGKSSLMVRSVRRLRQEGATVAVLDLTAIGQNLTVEQWYDGLMARLGQQLDLEDEILEFWRSHEEWGPLQRWTTALEKVVLERFPGRVVIFVDEIDIVRSLAFSTDEFFAAIRECYNRRSSDPRFNRLTFGLLGVAAPTDLIRDTRMTPFNIGHRIELNDFTEEEAAPLAGGLKGIEMRTEGRVLATDLLRRVLYWTNGHPYLTQRLCQAVAVDDSIRNTAGVDRLCAALFLAPRAREQDDNLLFVRERLLRTETEIACLLDLYRKVRRGKAVPDDETNPLVTVLRLSGIVRAKEGRLHNRNRIYYRVFDEDWVRSNMPDAELRRQKGAFRRGLLRGIIAAVILGFIISKIVSISEEQQREKIIKNLGIVYDPITAYEDVLNVSVEKKMGGGVTFAKQATADASLTRPNQFAFRQRRDAGPDRLDLQLPNDNLLLWFKLPKLSEVLPIEALPPSALKFGDQLFMPQNPGWFCSMLYRTILSDKPSQRLARFATNRKFVQEDVFEGVRCYRIKWDHGTEDFIRGLGRNRGNSEVPKTIPVTAWVRKDNGLIIRWQATLSKDMIWLWSTEREPVLGVDQIVATITHQQIQLHHKGSSQVTKMRPGKNFEAIKSPKSPHHPPGPPVFVQPNQERINRLIPPRPHYALPGLIDLTPFYNASLTEAWHPGSRENNLSALPSGILTLDGIPFDVRGVIQLTGRALEEAGGRFSQQVTNIPVNQKCQRLHFLHAAGWKADQGEHIGSYIVHYTGGERRVIPIIYGQHLRDWNRGSDSNKSVPNAKVVWSGINPGQFEVRLFKFTWDNPLPNTTISTVDFISKGANAAPFLIALTADDGG